MEQSITLDGFELLVVEYKVEQGDKEVGAPTLKIPTQVIAAEFYDEEGEVLIKTTIARLCEMYYKLETKKNDFWDAVERKLNEDD